MNTPFHYPSLTFQQLKDISKSRGKRWSHERSYRNDCIDVIHRTCDALHIKRYTRDRAVIMMHRYFTSVSSATCTGLDKWAHAVACFCICNKTDSGYDRLENIVHSAIVELRKLQGRAMEPEYFKPDGTAGNPAYLAQLADKVRQAEQEVLLATNFAMPNRTPSFLVSKFLQQLKLTDESEQEFPDLATKINAVRVEATHTANASVGKGQVVVLLYPETHVALGCIFKACKANQLQWYLGPPEDQEKQKQNTPGYVEIPELSVEKLAEIARDLPTIPGSGFGAEADPQQNNGHGCFRSRGGRWQGQTPSRSALVKYEGGIRLSSVATGSSNGEAATGLRLGEPSPSPDSINGPLPSAPGSIMRRRVTFDGLPPSVTLLHGRFKKQRDVEQQHKRERSPEPNASLDSDQEDLSRGSRQQQQGSALGLKRARPEVQAAAAIGQQQQQHAEDEDDSSADSKAAQEQQAAPVAVGQQQQQGGVLSRGLKRSVREAEGDAEGDNDSADTNAAEAGQDCAHTKKAKVAVC